MQERKVIKRGKSSSAKFTGKQIIRRKRELATLGLLEQEVKMADEFASLFQRKFDAKIKGLKSFVVPRRSQIVVTANLDGLYLLKVILFPRTRNGKKELRIEMFQHNREADSGGVLKGFRRKHGKTVGEVVMDSIMSSAYDLGVDRIMLKDIKEDDNYKRPAIHDGRSLDAVKDTMVGLNDNIRKGHEFNKIDFVNGTKYFVREFP